VIVVGIILSLPAQIPQRNFTIATYAGIMVLVVVAIYFALYFGWWNRRKKKIKADIAPINLKKFHNNAKTENELKYYDAEQLRFRAELHDEIELMRLELENVENPKEIPFSVWNRYKPDKKRKLVGNNDEYEAIQDFYTCLQARYDYQKSMNRPDGKFSQLNAKCIDEYNTAMRDVGWSVS